MKEYIVRIDPSNVIYINKVHNLYRGCDMDKKDLEEFLLIINEIKKELWNGDLSIYNKLSLIFPVKDLKDPDCVYYKVVGTIKDETCGYNHNKKFPVEFNDEMKHHQCLYIELITIIMDMFRIADIYMIDYNNPKKKLSINEINTALSKNVYYKHFYN